MKKIYLLILIVVFSFVFLACDNNDKKSTTSNSENKNEENKADKEIFEVKDKYFIAQINDIYLNIDDYKDKIVRVEGIYTNFTLDGESEPIQMVFRNGPGCCGNDGWAGFTLEYDGKKPKENDWVLVEGIPKLVNKEGFDDLYLEVTKLEVKKERGQEFVTH